MSYKKLTTEHERLAEICEDYMDALELCEAIESTSSKEFRLWDDIKNDLVKQGKI